MQARHRAHDRCRFPQMTGPEQLSAYGWLSRDVSAIAAGMEINLSGWQLLALSGQSDRTRVCPLLDNSGQKWVSARDGLPANDPYRPFALPYIIAPARDNRDARKETINQGERHENELQGGHCARRW